MAANLPPIAYASLFYAKMLSRLDTYVGEVQEDDGGAVTVERTQDPEALAAYDDIQDLGGGRSTLQEKYGRLEFIAGESYLVGTVQKDLQTWAWEVLSTSEWRPGAKNSGEYRRYRQPGSSHEVLKEAPADATRIEAGQVRSYRLWNSDPEYSSEPSSPMRAVIDICETLLLMYQQMHGVTLSRLAGPGLLMITDDITLEGESDDPADPPDDPDSDPILKRLVAAATASIRNPRSASAALPIILRGGDGSKVEHIDFASNRATMAKEERTELIELLALGLDMPPEILLGLEQSNHWTAWQISEQVWESHGRPVAERWCDAMSEVILRPRLIAAGKTPEEARRFRVAYDASAIVSHPSRTRDAFGAHDRLVISDEALRGVIGFDDTDAPSDAEWEKRIALWKPPRLQSTTGGSPGAPDASQASAVEGAVLAAVARSREAAGAKLRVRANRVPELAARINGVPNHDLPRLLGPLGATLIGSNRARLEELVTGSTRPLAQVLEQLGVSEAVREHLCSKVETHVASTLFADEEQALPADVRGLIDAAVA